MIDVQRLDARLMSQPGATKDYKAEWEWDRYMVGGKMFAAICRPSDKYDSAYSGHLLLSLKCEPMEAEFLRERYADILPGFYMDKRNWISVCLDGAVPEELLWRLCDDSYGLIFGKLTKKLQKEILAPSQSL